MAVLANIHLAMGQLDQSIPLWEEALRLSRKHNGAEHLVTLLGDEPIAAAYGEAGRTADEKMTSEETLPNCGGFSVQIIHYAYMPGRPRRCVG